MNFRSLFVAFMLTLSQLSMADDYEYQIQDDWITLPDGVRLAVTYYLPQAKQEGERFPILLEMLPYRKDDLSKPSAHPMYDYFARQGLALAKVDVRGTGSSEGQLPTREYSQQEIDDGVAVIAALAQRPWSNGNVGMWGISWGGFNSIQVALRNPPQLKAILAAHASDDLYANDVHYTDGIFGLDEYILSINHLTGFMQSPDYAVDEDYFANRFDREPWIFNYLRNNRDGEFWRQGSLKWQYDKLKIPVYLIGGLFDGYRDTLPHVLENANSPVRAVLGPWPHAWPHSVTPGPNWEWREDASRWWKYWLDEHENQTVADTASEFASSSFRYFLRSGTDSLQGSEAIEGKWIDSPWPLSSTQINTTTLYPGIDSGLQVGLTQDSSATVTLVNNAGAGIELGEWWGELLPDMATVDSSALVFDSEPMTQAQALVGEAIVSLQAASNSTDGNWIVRLEDLSPEGVVTHITGGAINAQLKDATLRGEALTPNQFYQLQLPLRMTTWTFKPGHRIRLAISNSAFPMFWPAPLLTASQLRINSEETRISLPIIAAAAVGSRIGTSIQMTTASPSNYLPAQVVSLAPVDAHPSAREVIDNADDDQVSLRRQSGVLYTLADHTLESTRSTLMTTQRESPANTTYEAWAEYELRGIELSDKFTTLRTEINLRSDAEFFTLEVRRILSDQDGEIRRKHWQENIPRGFQ